MNPNIFREYDIRGRVPEDLNKDTVYELGRAIGVYFVKKGVKRISLGRDCRLSSSEIRDILADALTRSGVDIIDIGLVPTPVLYFSLFNLEVQGGVQITGSHNPPEYNGFKVCVGKTTIYGEEIQKIRKIGEEGSFVEGQGSYKKEDIVSTYISYVVENMRLGKNRVKVVVDGGNGVGGQVAIEIYS
ncbi:MAG TPA: phosphomannomutase, partial [Desulfobacteraceae bacterium]|nr:phosphomannomutase [Desulfobacteraceae bacterium]